MPVGNDYLEFVLEQLSVVGPVNARKMFGGAGIYLRQQMFALVANDALYLKEDNRNRADYEAILFPVVMLMTLGEILFALWVLFRGAKVPETES